MKFKRIPVFSFLPNVAGLFIVLIIWSCAAEGTAGGGPSDETGPKIIEVTPDPEAVFLSGKDVLTIRFDELVDPLSVPASIRVQPDIQLLIKTRGKIVEIEPESTWPRGTIIHIALSRRIRDYQLNKMAEQADLYFSTGGELPNGEISGRIFNSTDGVVVESGLYRLAEDLAPEMVHVAEADENGSFVFRHIPDGQYFIACVEGVLTDFSKEIRSKRYGMQSVDIVTVIDGSILTDIAIWMDEPVKRLSLKSMQFKNSEFGDLELSDGSTIPYTFSIPKDWDREIPVFEQRTESIIDDSIFVTVDLKNRLERYQTDPLYFKVPSIQDSIPPDIRESGYKNEDYLISFTEPVIPEISGNLLEYMPDSITTKSVDYQFKDPHSILVDFTPIQSMPVVLNLQMLKDYFGNSFQDSIFTFIMDSVQHVKSKIEGGSVKGIINYSGTDSLMVEATRVETGDRYFTLGKTEFYFQNIAPGGYVFKAFETDYGIDPQTYFSGLWEPLQRAARMGISADTVEVRKRWIIEGVKIDMK
ncbi:MAG: Ig-like domain-containing protein [Candidatus Marinimicrobia bacterium]|nr:Ig-like domain-containing protein [Candidatus Neomarinimicrobiota bacterium]